MAGTYEVTASVDGTPITYGSPALIRFKAAPFNTAQTATSFTASTGEVLADGVTPHTAALTAQDRFGNPIPDRPIRFVLDPSKRAHFSDPLTGANLGQEITVDSSLLGAAKAHVVSDQSETTHLTAYSGTTKLGEADFEFAG